MRKCYYLIILLSCLHLAARGQTLASLDDIDLSGLPKATKAKALRYWFDDDGGSVKTVNQLKGKQTLDASALLDGLHTLHYQVVDENNKVADVRSSLFMKVNGKAIDVTSKQLRYWFDDDATTVKTITAANSTQTVDASQLLDGLHTIHYQVIGSDNAAYHVVSALFMKMGGSSGSMTAKQLRYWFDDDATTIKTVTAANGTQTVDASQLLDGLHAIHYQVIDGDNVASYVVSALFMKMDNGGNVSAKQLRYWFDDDASTLKTTTATNGLQTVDASRLLEGLHTIHYQIVNSNGTLGATYSSLFMKMDVKAKPNELSVRYWFDNQHVNARQVELSEVMIVDAAELPEGTHLLHCQLVADDGEVFPITTKSFDRGIYDIYISESTEYAESTVSSDPLFAGKPSLKLHHTTDDVNVRGHLTVDEGTTLSLGKFVQSANWGSKNDGKYTKAGTDYYHPTTLLNNGFMRADSVMVKQDFYRDRWHFFSLPFTANVSDIEVPEGTYWALRSYDGEARATGLMNETWRNLRSGDQMEAGRGYIIQLTKEGEEKASRLTFKSINDTKKNNIFTTVDVDVPLEEHQSEFPHNRSWNLIGNPYPSFFDTRCMAQNGTIIVWNGNGYSAYSLMDDSYILMPFEAFFIQKPLTADAVTFSKEGRQHTYEVLPRAEARRTAGADRRSLNFTLSDGNDADRSRVVINEQASMGYEADKDAPKFMEKRPQIPQLFSVEGGVQYAINERPQGDGLITFSLYVPADGEYRFSVEGDADNLTLSDAETGAVWALADGDYVFTATAGQHNARLIVSFTGETTAIAQVSAYDDGEMKVADGQLAFSFMRDKHIKVFGLDGRILFNDTVSHASVKVARGVYVVDMDGKTMKIMVK